MTRLGVECAAASSRLCAIAGYRTRYGPRIPAPRYQTHYRWQSCGSIVTWRRSIPLRFPVAHTPSLRSLLHKTKRRALAICTLKSDKYITTHLSYTDTVKGIRLLKSNTYILDFNSSHISPLISTHKLSTYAVHQNKTSFLIPPFVCTEWPLVNYAHGLSWISLNWPVYI